MNGIAYVLKGIRMYNHVETRVGIRQRVDVDTWVICEYVLGQLAQEAMEGSSFIYFQYLDIACVAGRDKRFQELFAVAQFMK